MCSRVQRIHILFLSHSHFTLFMVVFPFPFLFFRICFVFKMSICARENRSTGGKRKNQRKKKFLLFLICSILIRTGAKFIVLRRKWRDFRLSFSSQTEIGFYRSFFFLFFFYISLGISFFFLFVRLYVVHIFFSV